MGRLLVLVVGSIIAATSAMRVPVVKMQLGGMTMPGGASGKKKLLVVGGNARRRRRFGSHAVCWRRGGWLAAWPGGAPADAPESRALPCDAEPLRF